MDIKRVRFVPLLIALAISTPACVGLKPNADYIFDPFQGWFDDFRTCRQEYADMDARVTAARKGDSAYHRVPGYPFFRTDRITASMAREVRTIDEIDEIGGWMRRMREFEYRNLGLTKHEAAEYSLRFHGCGGALATVEFMDSPEALKRLIEVVQPPDEYSTVQRFLGLYSAAMPGMRQRLIAHRHSLEDAYRQALINKGSPPAHTLWKPRLDGEVSDLSGIELGAMTDELGFPALTEGQWRALMLEHAPHLLIQGASERDVPAQPVLTAAGAGADLTQHRVHYYITFTRVGHRVLPQLNYFFWFRGEGNPAPLDGFIWRVTLDADAKPLVYERLHTSGSLHEWYPVQHLVVRTNVVLEDPPIVAPEPAPMSSVTLRLMSGSHAMQRVLELSDARPETEAAYELVRLEELFSMPLPGGGGQRLFGPEGLVAGPHGEDPIGGRASGIHEPGALRLLGRHPIAHVGRAHFDDPFLLESVFEVPEQRPLRPIAGPLYDPSNLAQ